MNFDYNDEQRMMKDMAARFCVREGSPAEVRLMMADETGFRVQVWQQMAELGWLGLMFAQEFGGSEAAFMDMAPLLEEMGRTLLPSPFFSSVIMAGLILAEDSDAAAMFLPALISGDALYTLAVPEMDGSWSASSIKTSAEKNDGGFNVSGQKMFVTDAGSSRTIFTAVRTGDDDDDITILPIDLDQEGVSLVPLKTIAGDKQFEIKLDNVRVEHEKIIGEENKGWDLIAKAMPKILLARSIQILGAMERVLEMTFEYVAEREQFGVPIGSFQAIQHHCVDMQTLFETARVLALNGAWKASQNMECAKEAAMAKAMSGDAFNQIVTLSHQVHGTIAFTEEYDLHLYTKHAKSWQLMLGGSASHRATVADKMGI